MDQQLHPEGERGRGRGEGGEGEKGRKGGRGKKEEGRKRVRKSIKYERHTITRNSVRDNVLKHEQHTITITSDNLRLTVSAPNESVRNPHKCINKKLGTCP